MQFGDVVFEGGKGVFSGAIALAQHFLPGKDRKISHASIVFQQGLLLEAVPPEKSTAERDAKGGVNWRKLTDPAELVNIRHVLRSDEARPLDESQRRRIISRGITAFSAFLGEDYSYREVLLHKLKPARASDMQATLGATFCSALVKRTLVLAGLARGLSPTLLLSPSELHAELLAAGWRPLPQAEFGHLITVPGDRAAGIAAELGVKSHITEAEIRASIQKQGDVLTQTVRALVDLDDALGKFTVERVKLAEMLDKRNRVGPYPFDLMAEADIALRWRDLGGLIGRVRWTQAKAEPGVKKMREILAQKLRAAMLEDDVALSGRCDAFNRAIVGTAQALVDASVHEPTPQLRKMAQALAALPLRSTALHYSDAHDALCDAKDPALKVFADLIELRLRSLDILMQTADNLTDLAGG